MDIVSIFIFSFANALIEILYSPPPDAETFYTAFHDPSQGHFLASEYFFHCLIKTISRWTTFIFVYHFFRRFYSVICSDLLVFFTAAALCYVGVRYLCRDPHLTQELFFLDALYDGLNFSFFMTICWLSLAAFWDILQTLLSVKGFMSMVAFWMLILGSNILVDALTEYRMSMGSSSYMSRIHEGLKAPFMGQFWCWNNETQSIDTTCGRAETPEASIFQGTAPSASSTNQGTGTPSE